MDILILKTNIYSKIDFIKVRQLLINSFTINECTVDLGDSDKVLRIVGNELNMEDVIALLRI